ncbi:MAG: apolipoprotein N-acyltransferase [Desulfobacterales bacterium]|nr:apolipoprotein N-acyltransferase [Desulfobacterales bacterium]
MKYKIIKQFIAPILSGCLLTLVFPKANCGWIAFFSLVPLLMTLQSASIKQGFAYGMTTGIIHFSTLLYWLIPTMRWYGGISWPLSTLILLLLVTYLALYIALFSAITIILAKNIYFCQFITPAIWVALEFLRTYMLTGFPWGLLGYSQVNYLYLIQLSDITGVYGLSFLIVYSNVVLLFLLLYFQKKNWQKKPATLNWVFISIPLFISIMVMSIGYGVWRVNVIDTIALQVPQLNVKVVQGNINQAQKWNPMFQQDCVYKYLNLSETQTNEHVDLIVWPETATPFYFLQTNTLSKRIQVAIKQINTFFLIGSPSLTINENGTADYYNSAYLMGPDGLVKGQYDKVHLVPYGEYVPLKKYLPFVQKIVASAGDFKSGKDSIPLPLNEYKLGIQICFEIIFPNLSRTLANQYSSDVLVNITNDAWFGKTSAPYQHFNMSIFRAIENRRSLIRSANTGISGFIDPTGKILSKTELFVDATLTNAVPLINIETVYNRIGDTFAMVCIVIVCVLGLVIYMPKLFFRKNI